MKLTPAIIETIRAMRAQRHTIAQVAAATGVCANTAAKYGNKIPQWRLVLDLTRQGMSREAIAAQLGSTPDSVRYAQYKLRRRGLLKSQPAAFSLSAAPLPGAGHLAGGGSKTPPPALFFPTPAHPISLAAPAAALPTRAGRRQAQP